MTGNTGGSKGVRNVCDDSFGPGKKYELDPLTLWLNYEDKIDALRSHFLTIAALLFALQSGIFALILDKIFLSDKTLSPFLALRAEIVLIILSVLLLAFFIVIYNTYTHHINRNVHRSEFVASQSKNICKFKNEVNKRPNTKSPSQSPNAVIHLAYMIYLILFLSTVGIPILRRI
jgi:hypothetical protein